MKFISLIFTLLFAGLVVASLADDQPEAKAGAKQSAVEPSARAKFVFPKLFDFATYRQLFDKHYADPAELARRAKLYIARVCTVFMSALMYKRGLSSKYLKIGPFTDWTNKERDIVTKDSPFGGMATASNNSALSFKAVDIDHHKVGYLNLTLRATELGGDRKRRKLDRDIESPSIDLHLSYLQNTRGVPLDRRQVDRRVVAKSYIRQSKRRNSMKSLLGFIEKAFGRSHRGCRLEKSADKRHKVRQESQPTTAAALDEVFLDYREHNCFLDPGDQGSCGACYAFSTLAIIGYRHCRQTGELLAFSEQYIVDCGHQRVSSLSGCKGGLVSAAVEFVFEYGLEMAAHYPYRAKDQSCSYHRGVPSPSMGICKIHDQQMEKIVGPSRLGKETIQEMLETRGPLFLTLLTNSNFLQYGGGVDEQICEMKVEAGHSMVLVGHGVEDGREYWLLRNSHGVWFGEQGYYKLAKDGPVRCIVLIGWFTGRLGSNSRYIGRGTFDLARMGY